MSMTAKERARLREVNVANANASLGNEDPKRKETKRKQDLDMSTDPKTGKPVEMKKSDYKKGGKVKTKKYMAGGMAGAAPPMGKQLGGAPPIMPGAGGPAPMESEEERRKRLLGAPVMPPKVPAMKKGGKVKTYKSGGKVRGAGIAKQGVRKCKMR
tara:strand:+ start:29 stop:496 length:468 start_codon:yes stop_codon:yes gene_type:complete